MDAATFQRLRAIKAAERQAQINIRNAQEELAAVNRRRAPRGQKDTAANKASRQKFVRDAKANVTEAAMNATKLERIKTDVNYNTRDIQNFAALSSQAFHSSIISSSTRLNFYFI